MKEIRNIMTMPAVIEIVDAKATPEIFEEIFDYLNSVDARFSIFKKDSEISLFNDGKILAEDLSADLKEILELCEKTKNETNGFFDIRHNGKLDPTGMVKGWAIWKAGEILRQKGFKNFYIEIAGDIEIAGRNNEGKKWAIGIRNPFNRNEKVKVVYLSERGIATSGTYENGEHIYVPNEDRKANEILSLTVIGKNIYEADRFATACFAMGREGINFIEKKPDLAGYMIDHAGIATFTSNFEQYVENN